MLLAARGISKSYAGVHALRSVSFDLHAGEVHALVGENGAGKSTLIKILTGAVQPDSGSIAIDGAALANHDPHTARALGIAAIYQEPALFPDLSIAENIGIALEPRSLSRRIDWPSRRKRARELLDQIGCSLEPGTPVSALTMPQRQIVEIAKAVGANARILILDEPTASLSEREVGNLFRLIRELRARSVGLIYISHRLEELTSIADRVTVLRDGQNVATREMACVTRAELIESMVGRDLSTVFPKREIEPGAVVLEAASLTSRAAGIRDISFRLRAGEIFGLAGLVGAGRTELAEALFGLRAIDSGQVLLRGAPVHITSPEAAVRQGIAYVPEDRRRHGLVMELPVAANLTLACLRSISRLGFLDFSQERAIASEYRRKLAIKTSSIAAPAGALSGGNQQKVVLGRWLATRPAVLILDEPTQGVDVGAKSEIHRLMGDLAAQGLAVLMISSELPEILGMSDRIGVMHSGRIAGMLERSEATQQGILDLALGKENCPIR